jgi:hypothetical protein
MATSFSLSYAQRSHYYELGTTHLKKINCTEFAHLPLHDVCRVTHELQLTVKSVGSLERFTISLHVLREHQMTGLTSIILTAFTSFWITLHTNLLYSGKIHCCQLKSDRSSVVKNTYHNTPLQEVLSQTSWAFIVVFELFSCPFLCGHCCLWLKCHPSAQPFSLQNTACTVISSWTQLIRFWCSK